MSLLGRKLRNDVRASWPRFALMVLALTISLTAFGGILTSWATVRTETRTAYLSTEPASATIVLAEPVDAATMSALADAARQRPDVREATGRAQFDSTIEVDGAERPLPLTTFVATTGDPMRMVRFDVGAETRWPPAGGDLLLRRDSLALLGVAVGDTVTVRPPDGPPVELRVAGTVYDPSLAPSPQEQRGYGYAALPVRMDQLKLQVTDRDDPTRSSDDRDHVVAVAGQVGQWLESEHGVTINEIQIPTPYAHPHEWQANVLLATLLAGGAAALVLSAILVATMLNTLFRQQIPQIGILKAVGARTGRIGGFYLAMTLLIAAAATAIALAPAVLLGRDRVGGLLAMIGVDAASAAVPWWTYAAIVAAGLGLPLLLALPPLVRASRITVRAAIDHHGGGTRPSRASALLARFRGLDSGLLMALRNTVRRPARFWLSVGLLASAGATFVAGMSLSSGTQALDRQRLAARYWDVEAELATPAAPDAVLSALSGLPDVSRVEVRRTEPIGLAAAGQLPITRTYPDQGHGSITLTTVPENAPPPPELLAGRWLEPGERGAVVLGDATLDKTVPGLGPGDNVRLFVDGKATTWRIAGVVEESGGHGGGAFTTLAGFADAIGEPERVDELRLVTTRQDEALRQRTAAAAAANLTGAGIEVALAASESRGAAASSGHLGPVLAVLLYIAVPMALIGGIGLAATMSANILDRFREFGVLHAIGARPRTVRRIVAAEGVFLALASCLVAALPALGLTRLLGIGLGNLFTNAPLPYVVSGLGVAVWLVLVLLGAVLATEAAATRAARLPVREALAYL